MLIYKVTNRTNKKVYVGKHMGTRVSSRWAKHLYAVRKGSNVYVHRAIRKYGPNAFKVEVIDHAKTAEELSEMEKSYIALYQSNNPENGYNMTLGGDGSFGFHLSESAREKLRRRNLGRRHSNATRAKISSVVKEVLYQKLLSGTPRYSEEGKKSFGTSKHGRNNYWFGTSGPMGGKIRSACSSKQTGEALRGISKTAKHKQALSEARKRWWADKKQADPNFSKKQSRLMVERKLAKRAKAGG